MKTLYTLGYQGWKPHAITETILELDATLLDIRMVATSPHPQWRRGAFEERFRSAGVESQYRTAQGFGNVNFRNHEAPIQLKDPEAHMDMVRQLLTGAPLVLMCGCRDHTQCHRNVAAHYISDALGEVEIVHLYPDTP
jgi:uncharacterized protein (DUF488 family)